MFKSFHFKNPYRNLNVKKNPKKKKNSLKNLNVLNSILKTLKEIEM